MPEWTFRNDGANIQRSLLNAAAPLLLGTLCAFVHAQGPPNLPIGPPRPPEQVQVQKPARTTGSEIPESPGSVYLQTEVVTAAEAGFQSTGDLPPSLGGLSAPIWNVRSHRNVYSRMMLTRSRILYPYQHFLGTDVIIPMTSRQKAFIAATDVADIGNLATITAGSAFFVASNANSAYGPGMAGFGRNVGYSLSLDVMGEFLGTFLIPSIAHQDPRYYRMPNASVPRRIVHAVSHTVIARGDDGATMPNYATLLTYPIGAELANLYIPGLQTDGKATAVRIVTSLAVDPADALLGEFLPDIAKRFHIRILFVQQIINNMNPGSATF